MIITAITPQQAAGNYQVRGLITKGGVVLVLYSSDRNY